MNILLICLLSQLPNLEIHPVIQLFNFHYLDTEEMSEPVIKKLDEIIAHQLTRNETINKMELANLLAPGENYCSEMMKLHVTLKNRVTEAEREINAVVKRVPENKSFMDLSFLFKKEMLFYDEIVPTMKSFLKNNGMSPAEYFPEFYGGRLNLTGASEPDKDAVLLLENLQISGFQNMDRHEGFDLEGAKTVIKDLAHFHAVFLAIKLLEPKLFKEKIKETCNIQPSRPSKATDAVEQPKGPVGITDEVFFDILNEDKECIPVIPIIQKMVEEQKKSGIGGFFSAKLREPFATMVHYDMWMNNTMQKLDSKGRPIKNKLIDFQGFGYNNPARDLLYLIVTSVQTSVLKTRFDYLLKYYHDKFISVLSELGCDLSPFSHDKFLEEVKAIMPNIILHGSLVMFSVFAKKGVAIDPTRTDQLTKDDMHPKGREKIRFIVLQAYKRGWI